MQIWISDMEINSAIRALASVCQSIFTNVLHHLSALLSNIHFFSALTTKQNGKCSQRQSKQAFVQKVIYCDHANSELKVQCLSSQFNGFVWDNIETYLTLYDINIIITIQCVYYPYLCMKVHV